MITASRSKLLSLVRAPALLNNLGVRQELYRLPESSQPLFIAGQRFFSSASVRKEMSGESSPSDDKVHLTESCVK
ncbi:hypothetical protein ATANTOWER_003550, partial [Ataeniobius toweri]|nr:hypothetical protein [Ataeniobius toweri]